MEIRGSWSRQEGNGKFQVAAPLKVDRGSREARLIGEFGWWDSTRGAEAFHSLAK
jgi:hypothetical protein